MPPSINDYANAQAIYANKKWKYYAPVMRSIAVLFNGKNSTPFYIKNGARRSFNVRANSNGVKRLYFGNGNYNYVMNTPVNKTFGFYKSKGYLIPRGFLRDTPSAHKRRTAKKTANTGRVNKLRNNVIAGRNVSKARLDNLVALVMRYQSPNAGAYYSAKSNGARITNNNGKKPTRKQVLKNLKEFKEYNYFNR